MIKFQSFIPENCSIFKTIEATEIRLLNAANYLDQELKQLRQLTVEMKTSRLSGNHDYDETCLEFEMSLNILSKRSRYPLTTTKWKGNFSNSIWKVFLFFLQWFLLSKISAMVILNFPCNYLFQTIKPCFLFNYSTIQQIFDKNL